MDFLTLQLAERRWLIAALDDEELEPIPPDAPSAYLHIDLGSDDYFPDAVELEHEHILLTTAPYTVIQEELVAIFENTLKLDPGSDTVRICALTPDIIKKLRSAPLKSHNFNFSHPLPWVTVFLGGKRALDEWKQSYLRLPKEERPAVPTYGHQTYQGWLHTLPFPIASALWSYDTKAEEPLHRLNQIIHVFEACAEFLAIIHLSAFVSAPFWDTLHSQRLDVLAGQGLTIRNSTLGTWVVSFAFFAKRARVLYNDPATRKDIEDLFCTANPEVLEMLWSKDVAGALQEANKLRNQWKGHSGALGDEAAKRAHDECAVQLDRLRSAFGWNWREYQLLMPNSMQMPEKGVFRCSVRTLNGIGGPFAPQTVDLQHPLENSRMYLGNAGQGKAMEVLPFVRIVPSLEGVSACYFFNRSKGGKHRFLSFHNEYVSDLLIDDPEVSAALDLVAEPE